ncbi:hypothetical protein FRUB_00632 [Fimbriiglobus ruber]|uniref:Uncharacterized protein n=1 Tax=Fimbriiglobus ruber TaxID=1908690 RepID=A0A225E162_9BACT|nr:hypothetical protein FRUB_00632 [Fimbriiglobus ruber]
MVEQLILAGSTRKHDNRLLPARGRGVGVRYEILVARAIFPRR